MHAVGPTANHSELLFSYTTSIRNRSIREGTQMARADRTHTAEQSTTVDHDALDDLAHDTDALIHGTRSTLNGLVQARLSVSQPNDPHELEAEQFAADFVSSTHGRSGHVSQPAPTALARTADGDGLDTSGGGLATTANTEQAINAAGGGGRSLPDDVRSNFEGFFGADLSGVRVHADGQADNLCRSIEAQAFTKGSDVYFASGQYSPGTAGGDHLLAHELTHVVQQGAPAISRVWSFDPRKWGKTKEEVEKDKKAKFVKHMEEREAEQASGMSKRQNTDQEGAEKEGGRLLDNAENLDNFANDTGGGVGGSVIGGMTADKIAGGSVNNMGVDMSVKADGQNIATAAVTGTVGLVLALKELIALWGEGTKGEQLERAVVVVEKALAASEGAVRIAAATGGAAMQAVPGIGLALTVIDLAKRATRVYYLQQAASRTEQAKKEEEFNAGGESDLSISLGTISGLAVRQRNMELAQVVGDIVVAVGQIAMLSGVGSPWGAITAVSGVLFKAGAGLVAQIQRWNEAAKVQSARADTAKAAEALKNATTDDEKKAAQADLDAARKKQLTVDGWEAAREILEKASTLDEKGKPSPKMVKLLAPFGIYEDWIVKFNEAGRPPGMFDEAANSIVRMIGTSKDPLTFLQTLKSIGSAIKAIWGKIVSFFRGGEELDLKTPRPRITQKTRETVAPIIVSTLTKQAKKGDISGFRIPDAIEDALRKPFASLKNLFAPATAKGTKFETDADGNVQTIALAITTELQMQTLPPGLSIDGYTIDGDLEATVRSAA